MKYIILYIRGGDGGSYEATIISKEEFLFGCSS